MKLSSIIVCAAVVLVTGCEETKPEADGSGVEATAAGSASAQAAASADAEASAAVSAQMGGSVVAVGEHFVELLLFERGVAEAWVLDARGKLVAEPADFKLRLKQAGEAEASIEMAWSEPDGRFSGSVAGEAKLSTGEITIELEIDGKVATGVLAQVVLLAGPTFGGVLLVAGKYGAEVAAEAGGAVEVQLAGADGAVIEGGLEVAANVEGAAGTMQRVALEWDADLGRFRGQAKADAKLAAGPFVLLVGGKFAARLPKLALRAEATHGGYVVMVGELSVELVADGALVAAFVVDASGKAHVDGNLELVLQLGGGALVKLDWDAPSASYRAKLDADVDLDLQPVRLVVKAGAKVSVGAFAAGSLSAKAKLDAKLGIPAVKVDLGASADVKADVKAGAKAKANVKVPEVKADAKAKAGASGGKAKAKAGFSIGN
jgi:hypothetical protein